MKATRRQVPSGTVKRDILRVLTWAWVQIATVLLAACGASDRAPPIEGSATVGAAGGTVDGPDGVQLVVPPGALDADVTIRIARSGAGAPPLPPELASAVLYEMTPHNLRFAVPVQIRIPVAGTIDADATGFFAEPGGDWATLPASFANGVATIERTSLSWYSLYVGATACAIPLTSTDPFPCSFASIAPGPVTTTPAAALAGFDRIVEAATLSVPLQFRAARDCALDAQVTVTRMHWLPGGPTPVPQTVLQQTLSMSASPDRSSRSEASIIFRPQVGFADNGYVNFDVFFSCRRAFNQLRYTARVRGQYQVAVPAPAAPSITQQPSDQSVTAGQTAAFSVAASGTALTYQWRKACPASAAPRDIAGATSDAYTTPATTPADDGCAFTVEVCGLTGSGSTCVVALPALLTVAAAPVAPAFTVHPASLSTLDGQTASLTAVATGTPAPTIHWFEQLAPPLEVGTPCTGSGTQTSCTFITPVLTLAQSGIRYYAEASNGSGSVTSNVATITVQATASAPTITTQPADVTVTEGGSATFSVVADGTAPLSYQWMRDGSDLAGANGSSYTLASARLADHGARFSVFVSNGAGGVMSNGALLTVNGAPRPPGVCVGASTAGWCWRQPSPHGNTLNALAFNGGTAYALGLAGTRMTSADGGATWQTAFGDAYVWTDLASPSPGVLVAVGQQQQSTEIFVTGIFRSTDGGQTWTMVRDTLDNFVGGVAFSDANNGVAVGHRIWRTTDGGANWTEITPVPGGAFLRRVTYASAGLVVAVGTPGLIMRSLDGGLTWTTPASGTTVNLDDVSFGSPNVGVAVGGLSGVLRTTDGGATWAPIALPPWSWGGAFTEALNVVAFADSSTVVALSIFGNVVRSTDAGLTWSAPSAALDVQATASRLRFRDATNGVAVGDFGLIMRTTDAGATWVRIAGGSISENLYAVRFSPAGVGLASGLPGYILRTTDGGLNWTPHPAPINGNIDLALPGGGVAVAASLFGAVLRSTDLGQTWTTVFDGLGAFTFRSMDFATSTTGVAVGDSGAMLRTTDGGLTWAPVASGTTAQLLTVRFVSASVGYAGGAAMTLLRTADAGATWSPVALTPVDPNDAIRSLAYPSASIAVMGTDFGLQRSADGGLTWTPVYTSGGSMLGVSFGNATEGIALGVTGEIARSVDAGATWTRIVQPIAVFLWGVAHADASTVIAVGEGGAILRNTQGGVAASAGLKAAPAAQPVRVAPPVAPQQMRRATRATNALPQRHP